MIDFQNTRIAFISQSDKGILRAKWLFRTIASKSIVKAGKLLTNLALLLHLPVAWLVKPTLYRQFVGGESITKCLPSVRQLEKYNVKAILDYSVEGGHSTEAMQGTLEETLETVKNAANDPNVPFAVFKPTAFATTTLLERASTGATLLVDEQKALDQFRERINKLCKKAFELDVPILIDAEDVHFQAIIDKVAFEMMELYNRKKAIVFNTYQMYCTDRLEKLQNDLYVAIKKDYFLGAKFVRGAYMERERLRARQKGYPSPIHVDKAATDRDYNAALTFAMQHLDRINIFNGTHNEESCMHLIKLMNETGLLINDSRIWHSQLYGMSDHISFNLAAEGYNVAKYMPYGPLRSVLPYLIRRAEENTSLAGQTGRELRLIDNEVKRRQGQKAVKSKSIS
ncbi:MAG: proline dehydrogenase family protein [Bacteroidales bacterium]|nr:proline dehydrogenase family protein [Bacteroidales bacterium]